MSEKSINQIRQEISSYRTTFGHDRVDYGELVPSILKPENIDYAYLENQYELLQALDTETSLKRAERGAEEWNGWVQWAQVFHGRWLRLERDGATKKAVLKDASDQLLEFQDSGVETCTPIDDFSGFVFPCDVSFDGIVFEQGADFSKAYFAGDAWFSGAKFLGKSKFTGATFLADAHFVESEWRDNADFGKAQFHAFAKFEKVLFEGDAWFGKAEFHSKSYFVQGCALGKLWFTDAVFQDELFARDLTLAAKFRADHTQFRSKAEFTRAQFLGEAVFEDARFDGDTNLDHVWFGRTAQTPLPRRFADWTEKAKTAYEATFVNSQSKTVPNFIGAHFKDLPDIGHMKVPDIPYTPLASVWQRFQRLRGHGGTDYYVMDNRAAAKFRRLAKMASASHNHIAERRFFRSELLSRRGHETERPSEIFMINLFEFFSGCGLSFKRPMFGLLAIIVVCCAIYFSQISWSVAEMNADGEAWFDLASYSVLNSLPLIGYASDTYGAAVNTLFGGIESVPWPAKVVAFIQNIASAILLFFALLAIRNYFKLG